MLDIADNILKVAKELIGLRGALSAAKRDERHRLADLLEKISKTLVAVSASMLNGKIPHGECGRLLAYSEELPKLTEAPFGAAKARELGDMLKSAYNVEQMAGALVGSPERDTALARMEEASGKLAALADILRAT